MTSLDSFIKKFEDNQTLIFGLLGFISLNYLFQNNIVDLTDRFTVITAGLLTFVAVFYTVIVVTEFLNKVKELNNRETNRLLKKIKELDDQEKANLDNREYKDNADICSNKTEIYIKLAQVKNQQIGKFLFISSFLLIVMLVLDNVFIPGLVFNNVILTPYILITLFWFVVYYIENNFAVLQSLC
jgi:xanthine/uracil/vitamin C permease (AzgA family)